MLFTAHHIEKYTFHRRHDHIFISSDKNLKKLCGYNYRGLLLITNLFQDILEEIFIIILQ